MIPIRDVLPSRTTPLVTMALIVANVLVFLAMPRESAAAEAFARAWGVVPADVTATSLVTSLFLHVGPWHVLGNVLCLWIFGDNVEDRMGHGRYLLFYALCGAAAGLVHALTDAGSHVPMVGANGAVAGVLGAYLVLFPHSRVLTWAVFAFVEVPSALLASLWVTFHVLASLGALAIAGPRDAGGATLLGLLGGLATGAALVLAFRRPERMRVDWWDQASAR